MRSSGSVSERECERQALPAKERRNLREGKASAQGPKGKGRAKGKAADGAALFRIDLGPNLVANKRIDAMLDELQRCLGTAQASGKKENKKK